MSQKLLGNSRRSSDTIASFLLKTYEILERHDYQHIICWDRDNIGFVVKDVLALTREVLPKYFRHSNFSSFVRQLNMYDFHKIKQDNDSLVFKNPQFCHGKQQNLRLIKRKAANKIPSTRKIPRNDRTNLENQKYYNTLKVLKKSVDSEIELTHSLFEKSINLITSNNQSNAQKIYIINQIQNSGQNYMAVIDLLFELRENCYEYFKSNENFYDETLLAQKKKIRTYHNYAQHMSQLQSTNQQNNVNDMNEQLI